MERKLVPKKLIVSFLALSALVVLFQNCSTSISTRTVYSNGGTGADGKVYLNYGQCPSNKVGIANAIVVSKDMQSAQLQWENCQELNQPQAIDVKELHISAMDSTVLEYNGEVFDQQVGAGGQKVTLRYCQSSGLESFIWEISGNRNRLYGSVNLSNGSSTGVLAVEIPQAPSQQFKSEPAQGSQFDLNLDVNPHTLSYKIGSGTLATVSGIDCLVQSSPSTPEDGSEQAPSGSPQRPTLLNGFVMRPPWKVAGVDYAAGIPAGQVLKDPLMDAALQSNPKLSFDHTNKIINVNGNDVTLDGYDFRLNGGYSIVLNNASRTTITNSNIQFIQATPAAADLTVTNCKMDGTTEWTFIHYLGSGALNVRYNWFRNFPHKAVHILGSGGTIDMRYNLIENGGVNGGTLTYLGIESQNAMYSAVTVNFNTTYQPVQSVGNEGFAWGGDGLQLTGEIGYNTMIAEKAGTKYSMSYMINVHGGPNSNMTVSIHDNYFDPRGSYGAFFPNSGQGNFLSYSGNFNMPNGLLIPAP